MCSGNPWPSVSLPCLLQASIRRREGFLRESSGKGPAPRKCAFAQSPSDILRRSTHSSECDSGEKHWREKNAAVFRRNHASPARCVERVRRRLKKPPTRRIPPIFVYELHPRHRALPSERAGSDSCEGSTSARISRPFELNAFGHDEEVYMRRRPSSGVSDFTNSALAVGATVEVGAGVRPEVWRFVKLLPPRSL